MGINTITKISGGISSFLLSIVFVTISIFTLYFILPRGFAVFEWRMYAFVMFLITKLSLFIMGFLANPYPNFRMGYNIGLLVPVLWEWNLVFTFADAVHFDK